MRFSAPSPTLLFGCFAVAMVIKPDRQLHTEKELNADSSHYLRRQQQETAQFQNASTAALAQYQSKDVNIAYDVEVIQYVCIKTSKLCVWGGGGGGGVMILYTYWKLIFALTSTGTLIFDAHVSANISAAYTTLTILIHSQGTGQGGGLQWSNINSLLGSKKQTFNSSTTGAHQPL